MPVLHENLRETLQETFAAMPRYVRGDAIADLTAVFQFDLTGDEGGQWYATVKDGALTVSEGSHAAPNLTVTMPAQDYLDLITGKLNGQWAFMSGKLKVKGDLTLAMKLVSLFKR